ncbi:C40 family peptidase [Haloflavibacter putidus]|uniref:NlpC/P60 family protein n=1 Tax=Haloflavibacter putidus TaxID=2576776 RepID=A0A507ZM24_9FLAO|nr:NlpC/P60 family protein [Haloflavibacter putidus]TQD38540.1 NlpC/P60 family protein [Haloflavibacter putidus]
MKNILPILALVFVLASCGSSKNIGNAPIKESSSYRQEPPEIAKRVANNALHYHGTRYKYGGMSKRGLDCSGLVYLAFEKEGIALPRISRDIAKRGNRIHLSKANVGDLVFFKTGKSGRRINHVGLIVQIIPGEVNFIHSSTSRGVIISSLNEKYWNRSFVMARRIL